jgi:hypothetical protein
VAPIRNASGTDGILQYNTTTKEVTYSNTITATNVFIGPWAVSTSSGGISSPYSGIFTITNTASSISTTTGALQVAGGVGIGGNLYVGGEIVAQKLTIELTTVTTTLIKTDDIIQTTNNTASTSTNTGALTVAGGVGVGGGMFVGGTVTATNVTALASTATLNSTAASVGYMGLPQNATSSTTLTISDTGKHIYITTSSQTITIPANSSVPYPIGTTITFIAGPSATTVTIAITSDTMRLAGAGTTGSRTLAAHGMATAVKVASTDWYINGVGLT